MLNVNRIGVVERKGRVCFVEIIMMKIRWRIWRILIDLFLKRRKGEYDKDEEYNKEVKLIFKIRLVSCE